MGSTTILRKTNHMNGTTNLPTTLPASGISSVFIQNVGNVCHGTFVCELYDGDKTTMLGRSQVQMKDLEAAPNRSMEAFEFTKVGGAAADNGSTSEKLIWNLTENVEYRLVMRWNGNFEGTSLITHAGISPDYEFSCQGDGQFKVQTDGVPDEG